MADKANNNQTIDTLNIDIKVSSLKKSDINKINALSDALNTLDKALSPSLLNKLSKLGNISLIGLGKGIVNILGGNKQNNQSDTKPKTFLPAIYELGSARYETLGDNPNFSILNNKDKKSNPFSKMISPSFISGLEKIKLGVKDLKESFEKINKEVGITGKSLKPLMASFGRIALYRSIRAILGAIASSIKIGVQNLAIFDSSFNKSMSSIITSTQQIQNSIGLMFQPLIEGFAPLLQQISNLFIGIANEVSRINAISKGTNEYTKLNADYAKDYANSLAKASGFAFDTFNVLSSGTGAYYETASTDEGHETNGVGIMIADTINSISVGITEFAKWIKGFISGIITVFSPILWVLGKLIEGIGWLMGNIPFMSEIIGGLIGAFILLNIVMTANPTGLLVAGIMALIGLLGLLVKVVVENWDRIVKAFVDAGKAIGLFFARLLNGLIDMFEGFINWLIDGLDWLVNGIEDIINFFGGNVDFGVENVKFGRIQTFADGGVASSGSLFIAGESGAELLTNMGGGNTGVTNVEQFEQAMTRSIVSSGLLEAVLESGNIYIDSEKVGRKVGQTKAIRNQLNRTNPNLKLR